MNGTTGLQRPRLFETSFQSAINVRYSSKEQVEINTLARTIYIPTTDTSSKGSYQFTVIGKQQADEIRSVSVHLEDLALAFDVQPKLLKEMMDIQNITRFEEILQMEKRVEKLQKVWLAPREDIWHDLGILWKAKKKLEADGTYLPHTTRSLNDKKLLVFKDPSALKCEGGKVKFILTGNNEKLGKGAHRIAYTCQNVMNGKEMAFLKRKKKALSFEEWRKIIQDENSIIQHLRERGVNGVIPWFFASQDKEEQTIEVLMPRCLGSWIEVERDLSNTDTRTLVLQVLETLKRIHETKVAHRDFKPENLLIRNQKDLKCWVADLERSCSISSEKTKKHYLTPAYAAPEILQTFVAKTAPDWQKGDMWAFGIFLYQLHYRSHPLNDQEDQFEDELLQGNYEKIINLLVNVKVPDCHEEEFIVINHLLKNLLNINAKLRWSAQEAYDYVQEHLKDFRIGWNNQQIAISSQQSTTLKVDDLPNFDFDFSEDNSWCGYLKEKVKLIGPMLSFNKFRKLLKNKVE